MKICRKCGVEKDDDMFGVDKTRKDGLFPYCRLCMIGVRKNRSDKNKVYMKSYKQENKDSIKDQRRSYRQANRDSIREYKRNRRNKDNNNRALYDTNYAYLTVDEDSRLAEDNISLEVRCKYCGKYFIPRRVEVKGRIQALKGNSSGDRYLYCSVSCKNQCPIYNQIKYPKGFKPSTSREVQPQLRKIVFERDDYQCQRCGSPENLHCHHITGVEINPIESADTDNCITLCKRCHKMAHKEKECSMRRKKCNER